jgi:signal transduction histidine kinase
MISLPKFNGYFMNNTVQTHSDILRIYLVPYVFLLAVYFLVIGGGGSWLYLSARHAQAELVTAHILDVIRPTIKLLEAEQAKNTKAYDLSKLSEKVVNLFSTLPHLRQISIRDRNKGYGVRLTSNRQLVDVELEPLSPKQVVQTDHQTLAYHLHHKDGPLFHVYFNLPAAKNGPVQVDIAFDRSGLTGQIATSMQSLIHSIVIFSVLGLASMLFALGHSVYIGRASQKMGARLQIIYQQAAMGKLAADLVHDLRNPLASIRANIKNLLITPEQTDEVVAEMDQDLMRLEHKLSDFLKLTKPYNGHFTLVDLDGLLQDVVRQCSPLFKEKQQSLIVNIAPGIARLPVMAKSLSNALVNLLVNARDHTPEQGHIRFQARNIGTQVEIMIEDDGPGIDADVLPHIFDPFFTTRSDGHGLGLAIVKRTIKAHNGTVKASNRPEGGARFIITLPVKQHHE